MEALWGMFEQGQQMTIFDRQPKLFPEVGDVVEGRSILYGGLLHWSHTGNFVYGVVTKLDPLTVETYSGPKEVRGRFIGQVLIDNSDIMEKGYGRIWLVLPLGRTIQGHLVNLPKTGIAVEVWK
jgi:hypothetical protein